MLKNIILVSLLGTFVVMMFDGFKKPDDATHTVYSSQGNSISQIFFAEDCNDLALILGDSQSYTISLP